MKQRYGVLLVLLAGAMLWLLRSASADNSDNGGAARLTDSSELVRAVSSPSDQRTLTFDQLHKIKQINVKEGDEVKSGQLLAAADSDVEEAHYQAMKIEADSTADIDAAQADYDYKKLHDEHVSLASHGGGTSPGDALEAHEAYLEAVAKLQQAKDEHAERLGELDEQAKKIEEMKLYSPIDGVVVRLSLRAGELADPNKNEGTLTIVQNNPVWVDAHILSARAAKLKKGDVLQLAYVNEPDRWIDGKILYMSPVVDAASDKQMIRLEVPNPERKPAGLAVDIRLNAAVATSN